MASKQFDSEGFDLGASSGGEDGVVYEIGGGVSQTAPTEPCTDDRVGESETDASPIDEAERLKAVGNDHFKQQNYLDAYDYYTDAIEACPCGEGIGPSGAELLKLRDEFEEANREKMMEKQRREMDRRRTSGRASKEDEKGGEGRQSDEEDEEEEDAPIETFSPPRHSHGPKLAVYYANRAATCLHLGRDGDAIEDCDVALLYNPTYVKAYLRRCTAHERTENTADALKDAQTALQLEPGNKAARKNVERLQKIEDERLEKLKEETMGKLKDLGNSLLSNFGLSLDNFNAVQDPNTGGYSINFNQNADKK